MPAPPRSNAMYRLVGIVGTSRIVTALHPVVRIGRVDRRVRAREAQREERERLWAIAVDGFPGYVRYQQRAAREIPVVVLEPDADPGVG